MADKLSKKICLELYTVRDQTKIDFDGTIKQVAAIGYDGVELVNFGGKTAEELDAMLKQLGLFVVSAHIRLEALTENFASTVSDHRRVGNSMLTFAHLEVKSIDDAHKAAETLNTIGRKLYEEGMRLSYHNHEFEFRSYDGKIPYDVMLAETDPKYVFFQMDTAWVKVGGFNPIDYIMKYPGRFPTVHIKDFNMTDGKAVQTEVGCGSMDFPGIIAALRKTGAENLVIEQDTCQIPALESVKISLNNLRKML